MGDGKLTTMDVNRETTSTQMTLAIYEELFPLGVAISDAPTEIGFRRNSLFLDIYELGIVARRALDAAYFIVSQDPDIKTAYDVDQSYFKWLINYQSNNRKHLRTVMRDVQKSAIEGDSASAEQENWGAIPLMGPVVISGGRLIFEVDRRLQKLIKDPHAQPAPHFTHPGHGGNIGNADVRPAMTMCIGEIGLVPGYQ